MPTASLIADSGGDVAAGRVKSIHIDLQRAQPHLLTAKPGVAVGRVRPMHIHWQRVQPHLFMAVCVSFLLPSWATIRGCGWIAPLSFAASVVSAPGLAMKRLSRG